jgi:hypothetical protein
MAYSEHVGVYRHAGGKSGDSSHLYIRNKAMTKEVGQRLTASARSSPRFIKLLLDGIESLAYFFS